MDAALQLDLVAAPEAAEAETGVRHAPSLRDFGFRDAEVLEAGLQPAVVQQCDLDRVVGRQRLGQQFTHALVDAVLIGSGAGPADLLAEPVLGGLLHGVEAAIRAEGGAASEGGHASEQSREPPTGSDRQRIQIAWGESDGRHGILWPPCPCGMDMALGSGLAGAAAGADGAGSGCCASRA